MTKKTGYISGHYNEGNRIKSFGKATYEHDKQENIIRKQDASGVHHYKYDAFNQLTEVVLPEGKKIEYKYDALGRRTAKCINGKAETRFFWDQLQLAGEAAAGVVAEYVFYPDRFVPICGIKEGKAWFYHTDRIGTVKDITNEAGKCIWKGDYEAFGTCHGSEKFNQIKNPFCFQGQYFDEETCLHYNLFRYYDPLTGRYITPDPISYLGEDYNLYRYAKNNPVCLVDPLGFFVFGGVGIALLLGATLLLSGCTDKEAAEELSEDDCEEGSSKPGCAEKPKKKNCCCCVDSAQIKNIRYYNNGGVFGHKFDFESKMTFSAGTKATCDCKLAWWEKTNVPAVPGLPPNKCTELYAFYSVSPTFAPWKNRKIPCPKGGSLTTIIIDPPALAIRPGRTTNRTLEFKLIVKSCVDKDCSCSNAEKFATATQVLEIVNGVPQPKKSSFKT